MNNVKLVVCLREDNDYLMEPQVYEFNSDAAAKIADRFIQREWEGQYVTSKIVYDVSE